MKENYIWRLHHLMFVYIGLIMRQISCHPSKFYAYLSRLRWIKRWGLMRNAEPENVIEHSWEVAVIAYALALIRNQYFSAMLMPMLSPQRLYIMMSVKC